MSVSSPTNEKSGAASQPKKSHWLNAWHDPVAGVHAFSGCVALADVYADGDFKIVVADVDKRLKIYKGTSLQSEHALLGVPSALCAFYTDNHQPRTPAIAVSSGPYVFIYRNLRPYYKFTLPPMDIMQEERDVWNDIKNGELDAAGATKALGSVREKGVQLSIRSLDLLAMDNSQRQTRFISEQVLEPLVQFSCVTCMTTLKKHSEDVDAVSSLVIGSESRYIFILDPQGTKIAIQCRIQGIPVLLSANGLFDVEYRIVAACRNGSVYTVKNGEVLRMILELESQPCGVVQLDKSIVVATMDRKLHSFHLKGKKNFSLTMDAPIMSIEKLNLVKNNNPKVILVALNSGKIILYSEKLKISEITTEGSIMAMRFGSYGRHDASLVLLHKSGAITVKMLQRTASLEASAQSVGPPAEQDIPLNIPKKTKLFVEQTQRERDQALDMHRIFQRDLCKLRLTTARAYVKIISDGQGPVSYSSQNQLRLNAQVQGIGPLFKLKLTLQNASLTTAYDHVISFHFNHDLYELDESLRDVPTLIPGVRYRYDTTVRSISPTGAADNIYVFVSNKESCVPMVSAVVAMPISEPLLE